MSEAWNGRPPAPLDGVPGYHWLKAPNGRSVVRQWQLNEWDAFGRETPLLPDTVIKFGYSYDRPVLTPEQIGAKIAEAVKAEREACRQAVCDALNAYPIPTQIGITKAMCVMFEAIRARGDTP